MYIFCFETSLRENERGYYIGTMFYIPVYDLQYHNVSHAPYFYKDPGFFSCGISNFEDAVLFRQVKKWYDETDFIEMKDIYEEIQMFPYYKRTS